jgi:hypothetical protein
MSLEVAFQSAKLTVAAIKDLYKCYSQSKEFLDCYKDSYIQAIAYSLEALSGVLLECSLRASDEQIHCDLWVEPCSYEEALENIMDFLDSCDELFKQYGNDIKRFPYQSVEARCTTYFCLLKEVEEQEE